MSRGEQFDPSPKTLVDLVNERRPTVPTCHRRGGYEGQLHHDLNGASNRFGALADRQGMSAKTGSRYFLTNRRTDRHGLRGGQVGAVYVRGLQLPHKTGWISSRRLRRRGWCCARRVTGRIPQRRPHRRRSNPAATARTTRPISSTRRYHRIAQGVAVPPPRRRVLRLVQGRIRRRHRPATGSPHPASTSRSPRSSARWPGRRADGDTTPRGLHRHWISHRPVADEASRQCISLSLLGYFLSLPGVSRWRTLQRVPIGGEPPVSGRQVPRDIRCAAAVYGPAGKP